LHRGCPGKLPALLTLLLDRGEHLRFVSFLLPARGQIIEQQRPRQYIPRVD